MNILEARRRLLEGGVKKRTAEGNPIVVRSLVRMYPRLNIYGWSTQSGTPSPENPVPIVSAGSVMTTGAQLLNFNEVTYLRCNLQDAKTGTIKSNIINSYFCSIYIENLNEYLMENKGEQFCLRVNDNENKKISIVIYGTDESGDKTQESDVNGRFASIVINDDFTSITRLELRFNRLPEAFTDTETIIGGIMFYKGDSDIAFEPYTGGQPAANPYEGEINVTISDGGTQSQTLTLSTPGGLPGIPVASGGNYTDANGQQWVCDEIDLARGKYVQRVGTETINGGYNFSETPDIPGRFLQSSVGFTNLYKNGEYKSFCNIALWCRWANNKDKTAWIFAMNLSGYYLKPPTASGITTADELNAFLNSLGFPLVFVGQLVTPIETDLSDEEIDAYKALYTYSPATTVSNDAGAWMKLGYKTKKSLEVTA